MKKQFGLLLWCGILLSLLSCNQTKVLNNESASQIEQRENEFAIKPIHIYFVRHAEKSDNDPRDPDLSEQGMERAERLKFLLADANINQVYATKYKRTKQTAKPLADAMGINIDIYETDLAEIKQKLLNVKTGNILVVGHSNTTPKLVNKLLGDETYEKFDESVYHNLLMLTKVGDNFSLTKLHY